MREFETGATRDSEDGKLDYEGFLSPVVLLAFAEYMDRHRTQADGERRDSDNWQKGMPIDTYLRSLLRHVMDAWLHYRGREDLAGSNDIVEALCAVMFNVQGLLHEYLR